MTVETTQQRMFKGNEYNNKRGETTQQEISEGSDYNKKRIIWWQLRQHNSKCLRQMNTIINGLFDDTWDNTTGNAQGQWI